MDIMNKQLADAQANLLEAISTCAVQGAKTLDASVARAARDFAEAYRLISG